MSPCYHSRAKRSHRAAGRPPTSSTSQLHIPRPTSEVGCWVADNDEMRSRSCTASASGEHGSVSPPLIADLELAVPADLAADASQAAQEPATFDQHSIARLGADAATLGPMSAVLLQTESASSSQIET